NGLRSESRSDAWNAKGCIIRPVRFCTGGRPKRSFLQRRPGLLQRGGFLSRRRFWRRLRAVRHWVWTEGKTDGRLLQFRSFGEIQTVAAPDARIGKKTRRADHWFSRAGVAPTSQFLGIIDQEELCLSQKFS